MNRRRIGVGAVLAAALLAGGGYLYWRASAKDRLIADQKRLIAALEQRATHRPTVR